MAQFNSEGSKMKIKLVYPVVMACAMMSLATAPLADAALFEDDFTGGADAQWGNEVGNWSESGGVYSAGAPNNLPATYTSLPFDLTDFILTLDAPGVGDGGVWLHSELTGNGQSGVDGVLLVTLGNDLYWHVTASGDYGSALNRVSNVGAYDSIKVEVIGDTYAAYLDGSTTPATTLTNATYTHGKVALYSNNANQTFDNITLTPEPSSLALLGLGGLLIARRRR